ncbi:MAG: hypothetical protein JRE40_14950 [Deltaproteobacteria bacterium]|nr:hypothetical protein [Deltaproteobacteria bacterium]
MNSILCFFENIYDWWQDERAETSRRKLARLKERDEEESTLIDLEIQGIEAETARLGAETKLANANKRLSKGGV